MTNAVQPYRLETIQGRLAVAMLPELNEAAWSDIERVGNEILERVNREEKPQVLVDLTPLNYMGSAQVALVVRIFKAVKELNGKFVVANRDAMVGEVLSLAGLAKLWTITETREAGLAEMGAYATPTAGQQHAGTGVGSSNAGTGTEWMIGSFVLGILAGGAGLGAVANAVPGPTGWLVCTVLAALGLFAGVGGAAFGSGGPKTGSLIGAVLGLGLLLAGAFKLIQASPAPAPAATPPAPVEAAAAVTPAEPASPAAAPGGAVINDTN